MISLAEVELKPKEGYSLDTYTDKLEGELLLFGRPFVSFTYDKRDGFTIKEDTVVDYMVIRTVDLLIDELLTIYTWERVWEEATLEDKLSLFVRLLVVLHACDREYKSDGDYSIYVLGKSPFEVDFNPTSDVVMFDEGSKPDKDYWGVADLVGEFEWRLNTKDFKDFADNL